MLVILACLKFAVVLNPPAAARARAHAHAHIHTPSKTAKKRKAPVPQGRVTHARH